MEEKKKKVFLIGMSIFLVLVLVIGGSYAWLTLSLRGTKTNVLKAGALSLILDDENSMGINQEKAVPMLDEVGETLDPYHFTLINEGSEAVSYTIYFDDEELELDEERMMDDKVKYNLVKDEKSFTSLLSTIGAHPNRILDTGTIKGNTTISYDLRLWIDSNAGNEVMGQVVKGKLRIVATQVTDVVLVKDHLNMSITGGNVMTFSEEGNVPISDEIGVTLEPYRFSLANKSSDTSNYAVYLDQVNTIDESEKLSDTHIKYQLLRNGEIQDQQLLSDVLVGETHVLDAGTLLAEEVNDYELRMWVDENTDLEEIDKSFQAKIRIDTTDVTMPGTPKECFVFDASTGTITDYLCVSGNKNNLPVITDITIPSRIRGVLVRSLGTNSFYNNQLTSVVMKDGIETIGNSAFRDNVLSSVIFPSTLKSIGESAFSVNQLTALDLPSQLSIIGKAAFSNNKLKTLILLDTLMEVNDSAFANNNLTSVSFSGLTKFGTAVFSHNQLTSVTIPKEMTVVPDSFFDNNKIKSINFSSELISIGDEAFRHNQLSSLFLPSKVTTIGDGSFADNKIANIVFSDTLRTIKPRAFYRNELTYVSIPKNVTSIGYMAFYAYDTTTASLVSNPKLRTIYNRTGKSFDWGSILAGSSGYNFVTGTAMGVGVTVSVTT